MSEFDSGSGRKGFVHDVMRRISSSAPRAGDSPEGSRERGPSRSYQDEVEDLQDAIRLFGVSDAIPGLQLCSGDEDWYVMFLYAGESLNVSLDFINAEGDLDFYVYAPDRKEPIAVALQNLDRAASGLHAMDEPVWLSWAADAVVMLRPE